MGDENKIILEEYANIANVSITSNDYWNDMITVGDATVDYDDWIQQYVDLELDYNNYNNSLGANDIKLTGGGEEMLRISKDGFYVNGVKVKQGKREAKAVYEAFKKWMTHAIMSGELKN
jgi:hypothetical protein